MLSRKCTIQCCDARGLEGWIPGSAGSKSDISQTAFNEWPVKVLYRPAWPGPLSQRQAWRARHRCELRNMSAVLVCMRWFVWRSSPGAGPHLPRTIQSLQPTGLPLAGHKQFWTRCVVFTLSSRCVHTTFTPVAVMFQQEAKLASRNSIQTHDRRLR